MKHLQSIARKYTEGVDKVVSNLENTPLKDIKKSISESETLGDLTNRTLTVIHNIEREIDRWENLMSKLDFYVRQEYNRARYKLDTSVSAFHWDYFGRANYVYSG